jgi:hypothetical protein
MVKKANESEVLASMHLKANEHDVSRIVAELQVAIDAKKGVEEIE